MLILFLGVFSVSCNDESNESRESKTKILDSDCIARLHNYVLSELHSSTMVKTRSALVTEKSKTNIICDEILYVLKKKLKEEEIIYTVSEDDISKARRILDIYSLKLEDSPEKGVYYLIDCLSDNKLWGENALSPEFCSNLKRQFESGNFENLKQATSRSSNFENNVLDVISKTKKASNIYWSDRYASTRRMSPNSPTMTADAIGAGVGLLSGGFLSTFIGAAASFIVEEAINGKHPEIQPSPLR